MNKLSNKVLLISCLSAVSLLISCGTQDQIDTEDNASGVEERVVEETAAATEVETAVETEAIVQEVNRDVAEEEIPMLEGYELLWHDEFNGDTLNTENWTIETHAPGWTNNELQEYTAEEANTFVNSGYLHLKAIKTIADDGKVSYTSGKVNSRYKKDFTYGRVVVSAKVPEGKGLWPAVWMMPTSDDAAYEWPKGGEIDIMEVLGDDTRTAFSTLHYGVPHTQQQGNKKLYDDAASYAEDFHLYEMEWEPGEISFYIDSEKVLTCNDWFMAQTEGGEETEYPAPFNQSFYVQMNLAVGGDWPGNPDDTTNFDHADFEIDYVRVYAKPEYDTNVKKPVFEARTAGADGNYITDGDFTDKSMSFTDDKGWNFLLFENGKGNASISDGAVKIESTAAGSQEYSVQLVFWDVPCYEGETYVVSFDAKADAARKMKVAVTAPFGNWVRYLEDTALDLTEEYRTYTYTFTMPSTDERARLEFNMGAQGSTENIYIKNVEFKKAD